MQVERAHEHTHPNTSARNSGAQPKPKAKHTLRPDTPARNDGVQAESAHKHTQPNTTSQE